MESAQTLREGLERMGRFTIISKEQGVPLVAFTFKSMAQGLPYPDNLGAARACEEAVRRAGATSGRTVAFSALTVVASFAGLVVVQMPFLQAIGAAGISIALVTMLTAVTLIPALLGMRRKPEPTEHPTPVEQAEEAEAALS